MPRPSLGIGPRRVMLCLLLFVALSLLPFAGCSNTENPVTPGGGGPTSTSLTGLFVGAGDGGKLTLTIASASLAPTLRAASLGADVVSATGILDPDGTGATIPLSGTYDTATDTLNVSGGGYVLLGFLEKTGTISGDYSGPNGSGVFGTFVGSSSATKVFCGSFENATMTISGRWNLAAVGNNVGGFGAADAGGVTQTFGLNGSATGTSNPREIMLTGSLGNDSLSAAGNWDTTTDQVQGTWDRFANGTVDPVDTGTWVGGLCDGTYQTSYEGIWHVYYTPTASGGLCGNEPIGVEQDAGTFNVDGSGQFSVPACDLGCPGTMDLATGAWTVTLTGDPPGYGTCPAGSAMGNCTTYSSGSGTFSQGGDMGTLRWTR